MRTAPLLAMAALGALTACARSEPAETSAEREAAAGKAATVDTGPIKEVVTPPIADLPIAASLRAYLAKDGGISDAAKWIVAKTDLNGDGKNEALVYLVDPMFCGTGGCTLYVLSDNGSNGWQVTDSTGPAQLPVHVLAPGADGWSTLGVSIGGGGAAAALMAVPHEARGYASNPTVAPAKPVTAPSAPPLIANDVAKAVPLPTN